VPAGFLPHSRHQRKETSNQQKGAFQSFRHRFSSNLRPQAVEAEQVKAADADENERGRFRHGGNSPYNGFHPNQPRDEELLFRYFWPLCSTRI
jgi:hypothetical protein